MDVESLQRSGRRRGGYLDVFVVISIVFLFVALAAVAVVGALAVMELRSKLESPKPEKLQMTRDTPNAAYKMQNFVYLEAISSELKTSTMRWDPVHFGPGNSIGSNFMFDRDQNSLQPIQVGTYFMYIDLNLTCTYNCSAGLLRVNVGDKLTCDVQLPAVANSIPVSRKCWTVSRIDAQRLLTQMTVPEAGLQNWKLELVGSGFGMFLVD